ncbi:MAG TPA: 50S ribosomal protein L11 methyltransferase [Ignavibacteriales bacterium]|nr:50S ribosomal protein L11 methyltransferase [Ignavibacteriales bacterium]
MKTYKEIKVFTDPFIPDIVSGFLWELDIEGTTEEDGYIKLYAGEDAGLDESKLKTALEKIKAEGLITFYRYEFSSLQNKNWNEEWEKNINVIEVSDSIVIKPSFREYNNEKKKMVITIDPKMSFGTGEHATTKIMLRLLEKHIRKGDFVLDAGTGTGVLAIASVMLGAKKAIAFDNDEWCLENGKENCSLNSVEDKVEVLNCEMKDIAEKDFDLITANIQKNVLIDLADDFKNRLKNNGALLLSGLLYSDEKDITEHYASKKFKPIEKLQIDEWIGLVFIKAD